MLNNYKDKIVKLKKTGLFSIFGSSVVVKIVGFISSIILVRLVSKSEYGIFTYSWNIYSIAMLFTGLGSLYSVLQIGCEKSNDSEFKSRIYRYGWLRGLIFNIILGIGILVIGLLYPFKIEGVGFLLATMCFLPLIQYGTEFQSIYFRTEKENNYFSISNIFNVVFVLVFSVIGAYFFREEGFVIGRYVAFFLLTIIGFVFWRVPYKFDNKKLTKHEKKDFNKISYISMFNSGISQMLYLIDVFVLGVVLESETIVASYKIATVIPTALSFIPSALVTYIYPYFTENRNNKKWCLEKYNKILIIFGIFNLIVALVGIIFAPLIIEIMYGADYYDAITPFRILMISYFFSGTFRTIAGNLLITQRKLFVNTFVAIISGIINIFADVILITQIGSNGAALATLLVVVVSSFFNIFYLYKSFLSIDKN